MGKIFAGALVGVFAGAAVVELFRKRGREVVETDREATLDVDAAPADDGREWAAA